MPKAANPELKKKALEAVQESIKKTGNPEINKNAEALGVNKTTLATWWSRASKKDEKGGKKGKRRLKTTRAKGKRKARISQKIKASKLEKAIANIETELSNIKSLFAEYRENLIAKIREG